MAIPVTMPRQGQSVESCIITSWLIKKGESVKTGDLLFSYETDKAAFDMESPAEGILLEIFYAEGEEVPVLTNVAVIGRPGENVESFKPDSQRVKSDPAAGTVVPGEEEKESVIIQPSSAQDDRIKISPRARALAEKNRIDISALSGSGPGGRIVVTDIERVITGGSQAAPGKTPAAVKTAGSEIKDNYTDQPLSNVRKLISAAMHSSLRNSAQLTHHMSADVRMLLNARSQVKKMLSEGKPQQDITLNDMVCSCVVKALGKFPEMNSHFLEDKIRTFRNINLGIAVDTPRGLMVPVVKNADQMDTSILSSELRKVSDACRKGNIDPELLKSTAASFTVSNLGNYGVEIFTPVINLPQTGILGVCTITHRPADLGNGVMGFIPVMGLSLTYDHRAVDGGPATMFLREIKQQIENFKL